MKTKNVRGEGFSVRFTRRPSLGKKGTAVATENVVPENDDIVKDQPVMQDIPDQTPAVAQTQAVSVKETKMQIALWQAAMTGDCYALRMLVMEGVDLEARDNQGRTAFNIATQYNQQNALKTLLAAREMKRMSAIGDLPESKFFSKFAKQSAK